MRRRGDGAEIGTNREHRSRHSLRRAIAGEEIRAADPTGCHELGLQQRQHHMTAAEDQRAGAIEGIE